MNELLYAADDKAVARAIVRGYGRVNLLLIDELGYMNFGRVS